MHRIVAFALAFAALSASADPFVYVYERSKDLLEGVRADGTSRQLAIADDVVVSGVGPRWELGEDDEILGNASLGHRPVLLLRSTGAIVALDRSGGRTTLAEPVRGLRGPLTEAVAASYDQGGRLYLLDARGKVRLVVGRRTRILLDLQAAKASGVHPDVLRRRGRRVLRFQVMYHPEALCRWVSGWKLNPGLSNDERRGFGSADAEPWLPLGERQVAPVFVVIQDLTMSPTGQAVSYTYTVSDVYPRRATEWPHRESDAADYIDRWAALRFVTQPTTFRREGFLPDCGRLLLD
jgi:hypothetical protein